MVAGDKSNGLLGSSSGSVAATVLSQSSVVSRVAGLVAGGKSTVRLGSSPIGSKVSMHQGSHIPSQKDKEGYVTVLTKSAFHGLIKWMRTNCILITLLWC